MLPIKYLTFHCAATPEGSPRTVDQINAIAKAKFKTKSYHWIVTLDGVAHRNIEDNVRGAHVGGHNTGNIGVVYVGGLAKDGKTAKDTRTAAQKEALRKIAADYRAKYPGIILRGHRDWSPDLDGDGKIEKHEWLKSCPCFDVATEL
jgi:N-acetylmuramoyl-L-alanine amidase